ncbi:thermonuclease family protein [Nitratidesulfovibrio sp. SRB-5]|uniref:thermonuclease family protein n=1 Tax=Nitratidesulfovibrio sp. SRB-5 TaxID=2872636 RepID=UPI001CBBD9C3|nr:thermonuclease family protein [Nitratidesulfovibrio sp. SRB-5]
MACRKFKCLCAAVVFLLFLTFSAVLSFAWGGKVVGVSDGDTVTVLSSSHEQIRVRLYGIDAPESEQSFGAKSKQSLSGLLFGKMVEVDEVDVDRYGRVVARLHVGQVDINAEQVRRGMAWVYDSYCRDVVCVDWRRLEGAARGSSLGLWGDPRPMPPWEWRKSKRGASTQGVQHKSGVEGQPSEVGYHGNQRSHVFHRSGCKDYDCPNCVVIFETREDAIKKGFRPCGVCRP